MKTSLYALVGFLSLLCCNVTASEPFATLEDGTLKIGHDRVVWTFDFGDGQLVTQSMTDVRSGKTLDFVDRKPDFQLNILPSKAEKAQWSKQIVEQSAVDVRHLRVEVVTEYPSIDLRRVFRVYPGSAAIGCDFYLRLKADTLQSFEPKNGILQYFRPAGNHWNYRAVEFFDRTDSINNLVRETSILAYQRAVEMRGNVLIAKSPTDGPGFFIVKESPCSFVQLHYPEYDFSCGISGVRVAGIGLSADDLQKDQWVRAYSTAVGISDGSELDTLIALRSYQKSVRRYVPERDEMIMMNTWGDRNKDARVGEQFVNAQVDACRRLGVSHLQIDDGWQQGLSRNSASSSGRLWDLWDEASWQPHAERFPRGFAPVVEHAKKEGVDLGLWFHPSNDDDYSRWEQDAEIMVNLYKNYGIRYFKIDGVKLPTKLSEINLRKLLDRVLEQSDGNVVFNLDATADNRGGYHYFYEYGNIFLENRYTDFTRYYPHWTLRNLWMLSRYVPAEKLQIEFLNKWRNADRYGADDPLAPANIPFDYQFALTMPAQPLAWFEGSELPDEAFEIAPIVQAYRTHSAAFHEGTILPIGDEPSGASWTGFQSIVDSQTGYLLILREHNATPEKAIPLLGLSGKTVTLEKIAGAGDQSSVTVATDGRATFSLPRSHSFVLYKYSVEE